MIALYRPGTSPLHRLPAGVKLLSLMGLALAVSLTPPVAWLPAALAGLVVVLYALGGQRPAALGRQLWGLRWMIVVLAAFLVVFHGWQDALVTTSRIVAVVLLATLIALTTSTTELLDALERGMRPLARVGVRPARVALTLALTITAVPVIAALAGRVREAQVARGAPWSLRSWLVPLLVLVLRHADGLADALSARGVD
ncbi:MAG: Energy-coupling factor transporter transmembrane protein EcfT [Pseudoclavibacter caeni]|jgi:biotin transport system permease protein